MKEVRVRFAPSPTGYLHIGGARTALYNWLFAKKHNGTFILRIEDTDLERSTKDSIQGILDGLRWLGVNWDEGPYFQSDNIEEHKTAAKALLDTGHAYKCFCTKEELDRTREEAMAQKIPYKYKKTCRNLDPDEIKKFEDEGRPYVLRFKVPETADSVVFNDVVYGRIERKYEDIEDFVILRSDGSPLYLLSNAVDDIKDRITHIIRGQDGLSNTPRQILIYKALGSPVPQFAHMPLTLDLKKKKISKRTHGEVVAVHFYREKGFLPWALANFLVLLGWHTSDDRELFTRDELIEAFSLEGIGKANSIFNFRPGDPKFFTDPKALSINAHYLRNMPLDKLFPFVKEDMAKTGLWNDEYDKEKKKWFLATIDLLRSRYHTIKDFAELGKAYFSDEFEIEKKALKKNILKRPELKDLLPELSLRLAKIDSWSLEETENAVRDFIQEKEIKAGIIINGIRAVITGQSVGPGLFDCMIAIGKKKVVERLSQVPEIYEKNQ